MLNKKILIAEDEEVLLEVLEKKLKQEGFEVIAAKNGEEGLEKMKESLPDLVLLDIVMPKKDGFGVMEEMKKDEKLKNIPVIIISNSGQNVEIEKALKMGVKDYLVKTEFDPQEVIEKVNRQFAGQNSETEEIINEETKKEKILIIEDDKFLRDLMSRKLKDEGYEIFEAIDGQVGLKEASEKKPDIILLDLILPGIDGFKVLEEIKQDPRISRIPVIILSNLGQKEDIDKGMRLGAVDFMIKAHFTPNEIVRKIKAVLSR